MLVRSAARKSLFNRNVAVPIILTRVEGTSQRVSVTEVSQGRYAYARAVVQVCISATPVCQRRVTFLPCTGGRTWWCVT